MASATIVNVGFAADAVVNWLPSEMNRFLIIVSLAVLGSVALTTSAEAMCFEKLAAARTIYFDVIVDDNRSIVGFRNVEYLVGETGHRNQ